MVKIKVNCLPTDTPQDVLEAIYKELVGITYSTIPVLQGNGIDKKQEILVLFPADLMKLGIGEEIFVEVLDLPMGIVEGLDTRAIDMKNDLAMKLGKTVGKYFSQAKIDCVVRTKDHFEDGEWES